MPYIIPRHEALDSINSTLIKGECLACSILKSKTKYILNCGMYTTVVLSKYPRTWGQIMIILNTHKTSITETTNEEWQELTDFIKKTTFAIEKTLKPLRCYISSLGATENLPNTCPHLHFNIIPIYNSKDKPENIFTWRNGVYNATEMEWENLIGQLEKYIVEK
jgi:diadenosine tetraphosphate (Ap4A) HIT family hydrolase